MVDWDKKGVVPVTATNSTRCVICNHPVKAADGTPIGRVCRHRLRSVDVSDAQPFQVSKAMDLIVDGAIVRIRTRFTLPTFRCVSSDGITTYLTAPSACTCPAGQAQRLCYHRVAARMLAAK